MDHSQILSELLDIDQTILHFAGQETRLDHYKSFKKYIKLGFGTDCDICVDVTQPLNIELFSGYDTIVLGSALELYDQPIELIKSIKKSADTVCIYEYKYEYFEQIDSGWHCHWQNIGLTWHLQQHFDFINEIFLAQSTLHSCRIPYDPGKQGPNQHATQ
jgi:hypothetical protein